MPDIIVRKNDNIKDMIFWTAAFLAVFWALGSKGFGGSEGRWAEIARGMLISGDYFHPFINHETYFDKPLFSYWLIAGLAKVTGILNEWTVRIPSALAGLAGLWAMMRLARKMWDKKTSILAGWFLLTSLGFLFWVRKADADMENMAACIVAVTWFFERKDKAGFFSYLLFYLICFLGAQTKGLVAVVIPFIVLFPYLIREKRWLKHLNISNFAALALGLAVYLFPFIYAGMTREGTAGGEIVTALEGSRESGLYMVFRENIERFFNPFDHKDPFYSYFIHLPRLFLPWSPLLALALIAAFKNYKKLILENRWLLESIVLIFLFFSISGSRRWYYILPILPFCCILTSVFIYSSWFGRIKHLLIALTAVAAAIISVAEILSILCWPLVYRLKGFEASSFLVWSTFMIGVAGLLPWLFYRKSTGFFEKVTGVEDRILSTCVVSVFFLMGGLFCFQYTAVDSYRTEKPFALELKRLTAHLPSEKIGFFWKVSPEVVFYMDRKEQLKVIMEPEEAREFISNGQGVLISEMRYVRYLSEDIAVRFDAPDIVERSYPWEKKEQIKKKMKGFAFSSSEENKASSGRKRLEETPLNDIVNENLRSD